MSFADKLKSQEEQAQKEGFSQAGGDWYKILEGANMFRVLAEPEMIFEKFKVGICYEDCGYEGNAKFLTYILDRRDNKIKLAKLPYTVGTKIATYENDVEFGNEFVDFPMPYDIRVIAKGAGTKEVKYEVDPSPRKVGVEGSIQELLSKRKPIVEIVQKMKENQKAKHVTDGTWQANQDRKAKLKEELDAVRVAGGGHVVDAVEYPEEEINPDDIPF